MNFCPSWALAKAKDTLCLASVRVEENNGHQLADRVAKDKTENDRNHQTVNDLDPLMAINAAKTAMQCDCTSGQTGDEGVAFAGGDPEIPGKYSPDHD